METLELIATAIANKREDLFNRKEYDKITDAIYWAWNNWGNYILHRYFVGEQPEEPTFEFRKEWVETELSEAPENWQELIKSFQV